MTYAENAKVSSRLRGQASYYADSLSGNKMAGGKIYHPEDAVAAHRTLPFGTKLRVRCEATKRTVVVSVEDRGPFGSRRRIVDLSRAAAERLGMIRLGVADVEVEVLK